MVMLILVIMTSSVFAMIPETMDTQTAERRSMETLLINSTNGTRYELFLISDNARYISDSNFALSNASQSLTDSRLTA